MDRPGVCAPLPVICVGNFTLGGAGKTPTALAIARLCDGLGVRTAFLSRGYGGRSAGPLLVAPDRHTADDVGDEPLLLASAAATVVSRDRPAGAHLCAATGAGLIVMDDGLQNPSLHKDLSFVAIDAGYGIGNGGTFPAGPLRVPLARQWQHVHGLVLIGAGRPGEQVAAAAVARGVPVHRARLQTSMEFAGERVFAFAGIGRPQKFVDSLGETDADIVGFRAFPDHHRYRDTEIAALRQAARRFGAGLVTTEKDKVRLPPAFASEVRTLPVTLRFDDEASVAAQIKTLVTTTR